MSERQINDQQSTPQAPTPVDAAARQLASARRRRFLKVGGAAVPTALTLASRPVMAWDCNTASMWGSVQGMSTTHSAFLRTRVDAGAKQTLWKDETYTKSNWINNTGRPTAGLAAPWSTLGCDTSKPAPWNSFKNLKIGHVVPASISGVSSNDMLWDFLNTCTDEYKSLMVVAWLNYVALVTKTGQVPGLGKCLNPQQTNSLTWMGNVGGGITGPDGRRWDQARVVDYLKKNYIALP